MNVERPQLRPRGRIFGLRISATQPLPAFGDLTNESSPDVHVNLACRSRGDLPPRWADESWSGERLYARPGLDVSRLVDGAMRLRYEDSTTFLLSDDRSRIDAWWPKTSALADTECYLSPVFGIMLRLRGVTCMHASAAVVDDRAIAFIGSAGVGKSTTAAALARAGIAVLTDDLLALRDLGHGFLVEPGIPRVQLWPESVEALWGDRDALPRIVPTWEKRYLDLAHPENRFCDVPRPLAAVYVLSGRDEGAERPTIETLRGSQAVVALAANTYGNYLLTPKMRAEELSVLGRLAAQVPVREVVVPNDRARIAEACDAMLDDFRRLTS